MVQRLRKLVFVEYDNPCDKAEAGFDWLCEENIQHALRKQIPNSNITVRQIDRDVV